MDWIVTRLGNFGTWFSAFPFAIFTIVLVGVLIWAVLIAVVESGTKEPSVIIDLHGEPYELTHIPPARAAGFAVVAFVSIALLVYGTYVYYHTVPLLRKYPLGYVVFEVDYVTPLETRRGLESFQFDFRPVRITKESANYIQIRLPDIYQDKILAASGIVTSGPKRVGNMGGAMVVGPNGGIMEWGEILSIKGSDVTSLVGYERAPSMPHPAS